MFMSLSDHGSGRAQSVPKRGKGNGKEEEKRCGAKIKGLTVASPRRNEKGKVACALRP